LYKQRGKRAGEYRNLEGISKKRCVLRGSDVENEHTGLKKAGDGKSTIKGRKG
jgi:hypothetical protein